jgi:hypothetical protein
MNRARTGFVFLLPCLFLLASCFGIGADISGRRNGSGRITLEYRVSRQLESLGRLDGNERWQTIPSGRADFERSLKRLPGLTLRSFSAKDDGRDMVNRAELEFSSLEALVPFLDAHGQKAALTNVDGKNRLTLVLSEGAAGTDPDLLRLIESVSRDYRFDLSFSAPGDAALSLFDSRGNPLQSLPDGIITGGGEKVSLSLPISRLLSLPGGLRVEIVW